MEAEDDGDDGLVVMAILMCSGLAFFAGVVIGMAAL
jgi:hypothetical protein